MYTLIVFALGFATAIYVLAPATEVQEAVSYEDGGSYEDAESYKDAESYGNKGADVNADFDSKQVMRVVKAGTGKFMNFLKVTVQRTIWLVKQKMAERKQVDKQPPD